MLDSLTLQSFGDVTGNRKAFSLLPDSLVELENPLFKLAPENHTLTAFPCPSAIPDSDNSIPHSDERIETFMTTLYTDPESRFVLQMFFLPKDAKMPLHDHPTMSVLSKVVSGSIDVCSYSFEQASSPPGSPRSRIPQRRQVSPHSRHILTSSDNTAMLTANLGNLHSMRALEPTLFFDILTPPYDPPSRDGVYYSLRKTLIEEQELIGSEISAKSIHSLWESEAQFDPSKTLFEVTPYEPIWFACTERPWNGPAISL